MTEKWVLVTGAAGFIGSHTAEALLREGRNVVGVDNFDPFYAKADKEKNLKAVTETARLAQSQFHFLPVDIVDLTADDLKKFSLFDGPSCGKSGSSPFVK